MCDLKGSLRPGLGSIIGILTAPAAPRESSGITGRCPSFIRMPRLIRAATIAQERANARSKSRCWQYVKQALLDSGVINSYPKTNYASQAGDELVQNYGFKRLPVHDQFAAPIGSVLVFGHGAEGHVVIRTKTGFVSDYWTKNRCKYPLVAVY